MNLNATLIAQFVVFFILAGFTMKFVWPPLMNALDERAKKIADGLAAAERGKSDLAVAEKRAQAELASAQEAGQKRISCLLYTSPSPRDKRQSRMPSSA